VAASQKSKTVQVYDSIYSALDQTLGATVKTLFSCNLRNINMVPVQKQVDVQDCGLFAIANATAIAFGRDPGTETFQQALMRNHLIACFKQKKMEPFP
jgi:hypothetical protein